LKISAPDIIKKAHGVLLEIGSGPGFNLPYYKNTTKLYALEPSKKLLGFMQKRAQNLSFPIEFINANAEHIPLKDNSVDTVVSTWALCSVSNPVAVHCKRPSTPHSSGRANNCA